MKRAFAALRGEIVAPPWRSVPFSFPRARPVLLQSLDEVRVGTDDLNYRRLLGLLSAYSRHAHCSSSTTSAHMEPPTFLYVRGPMGATGSKGDRRSVLRESRRRRGPCPNVAARWRAIAELFTRRRGARVPRRQSSRGCPRTSRVAFGFRRLRAVLCAPAGHHSEIQATPSRPRRTQTWSVSRRAADRTTPMSARRRRRRSSSSLERRRAAAATGGRSSAISSRAARRDRRTGEDRSICSDNTGDPGRWGHRNRQDQPTVGNSPGTEQGAGLGCSAAATVFPRRRLEQPRCVPERAGSRS